MREAPVGLVGAFVAERPYLSVCVLALALAALAIVGARQAGGDAGETISLIALTAAAMLIAPMALAAAAPRGGVALAGFAVMLTGVCAALVALDLGAIQLPIDILSPPRAVVMAAFAYFAFLIALAPLARNVTRLGVLASFGAVLGVAGAAGYLALEGYLGGPGGAIAIALAMTIGIGTGVNVAADFSTFFAEGEHRRRAAAAAGHSAIASSAFALMALVNFFVIYAYSIDAGGVDWLLVWVGFAVGAAAIATGLVAVIGGLVVSDINEQTALDENRRKQWFAARWRPLRLALPAVTATATVAIAAILVVIAAFEVGITAPARFAVFIVALTIAAALAFVSVRTSLLIAIVLTASAFLADYAMAIVGVAGPATQDRFAALTLGAIALGALTVSWRDASETWRNARDVVENALSDGLRRYLFIVGAGAASLFATLHALQWSGALPTMIYFLTVALIGLLLAPPAMMAMTTISTGVRS